MSKNILLKIAYDGTNYCGWQIQDNAPTVQAVIEAALLKLHDGIETPIIGCSRTDAGVHALGYCGNFQTDLTIPPEKFSYALNALLPDDVKVVSSTLVPDDFHARYSVKSKTYIYRFYNSTFESPLLATRAWHIKAQPDMGKMSEAAGYFCGTHDFTSFMAAGGYPTTTTRTVFNATIDRDEYGIYRFSVTGDGFLYNMVRIMTGTLVYAGLGKIHPADITEIIESCDRKKAGITAPPQGLYLAQVNY